MRILGIDPGVATVGYGVVEFSPGSREAVVYDYGVVRTPAGVPLQMRLASVYEDVSSLFSIHRPDLLAIEKLFFYRMGNTITVAQARGVIMLCAGQSEVPTAEFSPPQVKLTLTGNGRADKRAVQEAVQRELALATLPRPDDAADALALALAGWMHYMPRAVQELVPAS